MESFPTLYFHFVLFSKLDNYNSQMLLFPSTGSYLFLHIQLMTKLLSILISSCGVYLLIKNFELMSKQ